MPEKKSGQNPARKLSPLAGLLGLLILVAVAAGGDYGFTRAQASASSSAGEPGLITTASGLKYKDLVIGTGSAAKAGDTLVVNYTAWLEDGTQIHSNQQDGKPYEFLLGKRKVLPGLDEGAMGMRVGGKRKLIVPPALAYGDTGASQIIPPNATIIYELELLAIR